MSEAKASWSSQPCCWMCWRERHGEDRRPNQVINARSEPCVFCQEETAAGIFVRVDLMALPLSLRCAACDIGEPIDVLTLHDGVLLCEGCSSGCSSPTCVEVSLRA